ncbi:hypothetical protein EQM14_13050 [Caproiciproducens sp. NJN-50]|uniref:hypothetical protein n=1 Tax=Acutalibacteraceae TaxID=3082771 RepID=UPI000FFE2712|nr:MULTISPECIES: hypothetical protein [Acutalibacteraceae]QAT50610.1 hypothetical protein EQM14_13050 [Caproiciproducens sp. NJN-50]
MGIGGEKRQKISLSLLRLAAMIFGLITLLECGVLACAVFRPVLFRIKAAFSGAEPLSVIGGANGSTAVYLTAKTPLAFLLPLLYLLAPILTAVTLLLLHRRKKQNTGKDGR